MKLLRELHDLSLVTEDAAGGSVGAGSIASVPGGLFGPTTRTIKRRKTVAGIPVMKFTNDARGKMTEAAVAPSAINGFNPADVVSKLKAAEKDQELNTKAVPFGLEDENGNVVKVYVRAEQADQFEQALAAAIDEARSTEAEIAEIIFKLKDNFDIVHVKWGTIPEDEEEAEIEMPAGEETPPASGDEVGMADLQVDDAGEEMPGPPVSSEDDAKSMLDKVIDMLRADAEAKTAEADAKKAEAEAKKAEASARLADTKMRAEQEVLDMEDWNKEQTEQKKEARKLAQLAKYRHEMDKQHVSDFSSGEF